MEELGVTQSDMVRRTGWPKSTMSQLFNGVQDFNPRLVREACSALALKPFELFLAPVEALAFRQLRSAAISMAKAQVE
jgi:transcriptional regulator with XRE-family HTH domain